MKEGLSATSRICVNSPLMLSGETAILLESCISVVFEVKGKFIQILTISLGVNSDCFLHLQWDIVVIS